MTTLAPKSLHRLEELLVADVMARNVTVIPDDATMDAAAATLLKQGVSGAPVVDGRGRCMGVLSAADFLRFDECAAPPARPESGGGVGRWELPWNSVQRYMSVPVHIVSPLATMMEAAQLMCVYHIHRLIVLDDREAPVGLVSTLDVVSAVVHAVDEDRQQRRRGERSNGE